MKALERVRRDLKGFPRGTFDMNEKKVRFTLQMKPRIFAPSANSNVPSSPVKSVRPNRAQDRDRSYWSARGSARARLGSVEADRREVCAARVCRRRRADSRA